MRVHVKILVVLAIALLPWAPWVQAQDAAQTAAVPTVDLDKPFPAHTFSILNRQADGPERIDLAEAIGTRPVVLFYWIAGHPRADAIFQELQAFAKSPEANGLALYGVAFQRSESDTAVIKRRLGELKIDIPVLDDEGFRLGQQLNVQSVPNISIIDKAGLLRMTNGASLVQVLGYNETVKSAIVKVARTGNLVAHGYLPRYYPVKELIGKACPDFKAPLLTTSVEQRWSSLLDQDKLNVLIFWSVDCPHCRKTLPEINAWLKSNPQGVNVVSAATVSNDSIRSRTRQYCELNQFVFPTLVDKDSRISQLFQITSTPTIVLIGPNGVIDSVITSGTQDFGRKVEDSKRRLLPGDPAVGS
jgi:peroxiredoxin